VRVTGEQNTLEAGSLEPGIDDLALTLAGVDADGALHETAAAAFPGTRAAFLKRTLGAAVVGMAGLFAAEQADAADVATTKNDIAILRFDLVLEYLQAGLYTEAERLGALTPKTLGWARVVGAHERAHVEALKRLLGRKVVPSPTFNYGNVTANERAFIRTAVGFEDLTAALLKWQAPRIDSRSIIAAAVTLHTVETRHAAWIRHLIGLPPAARAFDKPASQQKMARLIASTGFVAARPRLAGRTRPRVTG
jgi:ferritin-like protein